MSCQSFSSRAEGARIIGNLALVAALAFAFASSSAQAADSSAAAPIRAHIRGLVQKFKTEKCAYQARQRESCAKLRAAATPAERAALQSGVQKNRDDFVAEVKEIQQDLKQDITQLAGMCLACG